MTDPKLRIIDKCEVCGSNDLQRVLDLGQQPLCDDLLPIKTIKNQERFSAAILYCGQCKTAHHKFQVRKKILFPRNYHYRSRFTSDVVNGMKSLVGSTKSLVGSLENKVVLDVGCNDGTLLDLFHANGAVTLGIEPTDACLDAMGRQHHIVNDYISEVTCRNLLAKYPNIDVITFTNVFAHIENLPELVAALSILISEETVLIIENHYLGSVLERKQFDTFYHEHPRTYSLTSFLYIAKSLNCEIVDVQFPERYGGNIRIVLSKNKSQKLSELEIGEILEFEASFMQRFSELRLFIGDWRNNKRAEIELLVQKYGKLVAKAFPGRASILISLLELNEEHISAVYEKPGSPKIGHYVPGTKIPINSDEDLIELLPKIPVILNLAWHIEEEIKDYLTSSGFRGACVSIF